jgi:hypothetical protein
LQVIHEDPENSAEAEPETNSVPGWANCGYTPPISTLSEVIRVWLRTPRKTPKTKKRRRRKRQHQHRPRRRRPGTPHVSRSAGSCCWNLFQTDINHINWPTLRVLERQYSVQ